MINPKIPRTILLVEDEALIAQSDTLDLKNHGYNVIHARTGQKAIEAVEDFNNPIDLILMDINLNSKLDGTETAKIILHDHDIPIIFHSSHTEGEIINKIEAITSYGYVVKGEIAALDASIKIAFKLHEAYQDLKKTENGE